MPGSKCELTEGALLIIMRGGEVDKPVVQVLASKKINAGRFRLLLSDGKYTVSYAMLTIKSDDAFMSAENGLEQFSVIRIDKYITSLLNNSGRGDTRVLLIMDLTPIASGSEVGQKLGNPSVLTDAEINDVSSSKYNGGEKNSNKPSTSNNGTAPMDTSSSNGDQSLAQQTTHPISSLSPYQNRWIIKARVTNKSGIRTWSNSRGEGKLFSCDLVDESGEIRLTGFKESVDKFYEYIQVDKVYYISKCQLKPANKQFTTLKNDYEMTIVPETIIQECQDVDDSSIPQIRYDFVPINTIANLENNATVDVVGVVTGIGDIQTLTARSTGRELKKRDVTLVDQSKSAISLTLWGSEAENFNASGNPIIVLKGARVSEFGGGKQLSNLSSTTLKLNPEIKECYRLRSWYDNEGDGISTTNLSARGGGNFNTPWMSFREVQDQNLGNSERGDYYQVMGTILLMRSENAIYKACPTPECNKKVVDLENGMYRCEKCNREYPNFKYRLLASMNVGDWSGNQWISMFSSEVEKILGMSSQEVGEQMERDADAMMNIANTAHFKQFIMKCRAKMETFNDESRLKTVCVKVDPIDYEEYNAHLISEIEKMIA